VDGAEKRRQREPPSPRQEPPFLLSFFRPLLFWTLTSSRSGCREESLGLSPRRRTKAKEKKARQTVLPKRASTLESESVSPSLRHHSLPPIFFPPSSAPLAWHKTSKAPRRPPSLSLEKLFSRRSSLGRRRSQPFSLRLGTGRESFSFVPSTLRNRTASGSSGISKTARLL